MIDTLRIIASIALPWALGLGLLVTTGAATLDRSIAGARAWTLGTGYLLGAFVLTLWMRALSHFNLRLGLATIALPLGIVALALFAYALKSTRARASSGGPGAALMQLPDRGSRVLWWVLIAWLGLRAAMLGLEVGLRPLFPWDAWLQWATKARVWYEYGRLVPFARADAWFAANGSVFFDASPEYPATVPLLQVWSCIALGRWDDALMNWPWLAIAIALTLTVYGGMRRLAFTPTWSLGTAAFVATLPLLDVHVALAGYADLPLAAYYTAAVLALLAWARGRRWHDLALAAFLAFACTQIKQPGFVWAATLLPGIVPVLWPRRAARVLGAGFGAALLLLAVLAQTEPVIMNYRLHLDFDLAWEALVRAYFLLGNWHLLFYGVIAAALAARKQLIEPPLFPLTAVVSAGVMFLGVVFSFTNAGAWVEDQTTVNRATLHIAPVLVIAMVSAFEAFTRAWRTRWAVGEAQPVTGATVA